MLVASLCYFGISEAAIAGAEQQGSISPHYHPIAADIQNLAQNVSLWVLQFASTAHLGLHRRSPLGMAKK